MSNTKTYWETIVTILSADNEWHHTYEFVKACKVSTSMSLRRLRTHTSIPDSLTDEEVQEYSSKGAREQTLKTLNAAIRRGEPIERRKVELYDYEFRCTGKLSSIICRDRFPVTPRYSKDEERDILVMTTKEFIKKYPLRTLRGVTEKLKRMKNLTNSS